MRIQILHLPPVMVDGDLEEPFALVLDQCPVEDASEEGVANLYEFALQCGATTAFATNETVEIVDRYAELEPAPVTVKMMDPAIKDAFPEKAAEDTPWLTAGWPRLQRQPASVEYHWMITYIVPKVGGFDFRQKSGQCKPDGRTRSEMFEALAQQVMDGDGLAVADFSVIFFSLEPNSLDAS